MWLLTWLCTRVPKDHKHSSFPDKLGTPITQDLEASQTPIKALLVVPPFQDHFNLASYPLCQIDTKSGNRILIRSRFSPVRTTTPPSTAHWTSTWPLRLISQSQVHPIHTGRQHAKLLTNPLMLLASSVYTSIHNSRFYLLLLVSARPVWTHIHAILVARAVIPQSMPCSGTLC